MTGLSRIDLYLLSPRAYNEWLHAREASAPEIAGKRVILWEWRALPLKVRRRCLEWAAFEPRARIEWEAWQ